MAPKGARRFQKIHEGQHRRDGDVFQSLSSEKVLYDEMDLNDAFRADSLEGFAREKILAITGIPMKRA